MGQQGLNRKKKDRTASSGETVAGGIELLAPAGSVEAFFAAIQAGADAVYCGLTEFSARVKAKNFTMAEVERLTAYAHGEKRKLYVTLNTLVKEKELPRLVEVLAGLVVARVDGIIIQDLGVWRLAREHFPELSLHASTQMAIHNAAGVTMLEEMGFDRAVLARELSLAEISSIRRQTTIELEHFVHGALCFSISGQCLFSSYLGATSGNRGRCQQPCRRRWSNRGKSGFFFSTSDLCAIELVPELVAAGVMSFKIEGRMKNAEYVAAVVGSYRRVLDAKAADRAQALNEARELLDQSFGRQTTTGFLKGKIPTAIVNPDRKGGIGQLLGRVEKVQGAAVIFSTQEVVHVGDRLRIQSGSDLAGSAFTIREIFCGGRSLKRADAGTKVRIPTPFHTGTEEGDEIYKVGGGRAFTVSEESCRRRLAAVSVEPIPVRLWVDLAGNTLRLEAVCHGGDVFCRDYQVETVPATHSPLDRQTLLRIFSATGQDSLSLSELVTKVLPPVVIAPSRLKEIRRDFYHALAEVESEASAFRHGRRINAVVQALLQELPPSPAGSRLFSVVASLREFTLLDRPEITRLIVPLSRTNVEDAARQERRLERYKDRIVWDVPPVVYEGEWPSFKTVIRQLAGRGFHGFRLNNLGHLPLFVGMTGVTLEAGAWLYCVNSQAVAALAGLGMTACSLSMEDDRDNMEQILMRHLPVGVSATVYGAIDLVSSRIPMRGLRTGDIFVSEGGERLRLDCDDGITVIRPVVDFSLSGHLQEFQNAGCGEFVVDLRSCANTTGGRYALEVLDAVVADRPLVGTVGFNYERGLA